MHLHELRVPGNFPIVKLFQIVKYFQIKIKMIFNSIKELLNSLFPNVKMIFFLLVMDVILKKNLSILTIIRQNVPSVKEELRVKRLKGINVRQEVVLNLNIFFYREERVKNIDSKLKVIPIKKTLDGVMILDLSLIINL